MTTRTTGRALTFANPFELSGLAGLQPAGRYILETDEELLQALSFPAYRVVARWLRVPQAGGKLEMIVAITVAELTALLAIDGQKELCN